MTAMALKIMQDPDTDFSPELIYSMNDSAEELMKLFCNSES